MRRWAVDNGFMIPDEHFFIALRREFTEYMTNIFPSFEYVPEEELSHHLPILAGKSGLPSFSLDRVYFPQEIGIEITRVVTDSLENVGLRRRTGCKSLLSQFRQIERIKHISREICLVDDVLFSGTLLTRLIHLLAKVHIRVPVVCVGIAINEGIKCLTEAGTEVHYVRKYDTVIDEVCERDFYPGVPFGGRQLASDAEVGIPYILPFGNPNWASIPDEKQHDVSMVCLHQTIKLFRAIEQCSGRIILCSDLDRKVRGLPKGHVPYVDALQVACFSLQV